MLRDACYTGAFENMKAQMREFCDKQILFFSAGRSS